MRFVLHGKIQKARVTDVDPHHSASITIDKDLIDRVGFWPGEKVQVINKNGVRIETFVDDGPRGTGIICLNGACSELIKKGEGVSIMGYRLSEKQIDPIIIAVDENNKFKKVL